MFRASRKSVINRSAVGKMLNSTGLVIYIETSSTTTDIVMFKLDGIGFAGALHDPVAALVFCTPPNVACSIINGKVVVRDGVLATIDLPVVIERHNALAQLHQLLLPGILPHCRGILSCVLPSAYDKVRSSGMSSFILASNTDQLASSAATWRRQVNVPHAM